LLKNHGISPSYFGEKLIQSGLIMNDSLTWICFAGSFDMAYLLKIILNEKLPQQRQQFQKYMDIFFPTLLDIKSFVRLKIYQDGGLGKIADYLGVPREGTMHQAGSDSMLTVQTFFAMFNFMAKEKDKAEYREILEEFNHDVYGFNNDQAYRNLASSFVEPIKPARELEP
jgi:CCR4-NOT transcription complex subunit 7/8